MQSALYAQISQTDLRICFMSFLKSPNQSGTMLPFGFAPVVFLVEKSPCYDVVFPKNPGPIVSWKTHVQDLPVSSWCH